jgi:hypothetical protein
MSQLIITCEFSVLFVKPRIIIDGLKNIGSFSKPNIYDLAPGTHQIEAFVPLELGLPRIRTQLKINLSEGDTITVKYKRKINIFFDSGSLDIESHEKGLVLNELLNNSTREAINVPDFCPLCKSPNPKKIRLCEWCGNHIY